MTNDKIVKIKRKRFRYTIAAMIAIVLLIYVGFAVYHLANKRIVNYYEVTEGEMAKDDQHSGIIIREEYVENAKQSGHIKLLVTSGKRVAVGSDIYSIDYGNSSSGSIESETLSEDGTKKVKKSLSSFSANYSDDDFSSVYDAKTNIGTALLDAAGAEGADAGSDASANKVYSPYAGIISFDIDGYEGKTAETITEEDFDKNGYTVSHVKPGQSVEANSPLYKIVTSEEWSIVFKLTDEERTEYANTTQLNVIFKSNDIECTAPYTQINAADGNSYGKLTFNKYMVDFISDRFVIFEIAEDTKTGLKIPKSAVVEKTFLTVPVDYLARGGDGLEEGFYKEVETDKGTSIEFIPTEIYYQTEENYYLDFSSQADFQPGDYIVKPGTQDRYKVGTTAALEGVYNINKGYAVFKQIDVVDANDEYYTVKKNSEYGLNVYDHILFDPEGFSEGDFIYE